MWGLQQLRPGDVLHRLHEYRIRGTFHRLVRARTVRRDIDRLRQLGYPVEATMGAAGGYRLTSGAPMPPLILDDDEAVAIAVGLRAATGQAVEGIEEASVRALAKLEQVLPSRLRYRVRSLGNSTMQLSAPGPKVDPGILTVLAAAIANHERVRFRYQSAASAEDVTLHMPAEQVADILGTAQGQIALGPATCRLHGLTDTLEWLAARLATLGCEFDVHGPPELIDYFRILTARFERSVRDKD